MAIFPTDAEKEAVWKAYRAGRPVRVPLRWNTNPRIILLNPELNPEGFTFEAYSHDPHVLMTVQARYQDYCAGVLSRTCDAPSRLPEMWTFYVDCQNTYDGAYFGAPVVFEPGQVPSNRPCLSEDDVDDFLRRDFSRPLENRWIREKLAFHEALTRAAKDWTWGGRKGVVRPFELGFDGPVTVAAVLMGSDFFYLLGAEPERARALMQTLIDAAVLRNRTLVEYQGGSWQRREWGWAGDDSIQLISTSSYETWVLPMHERWYQATSETTPASRRRGIHLCGDVMRHMPILHERLGVVSFDTGFPMDHGEMRRVLGPEVEIAGGPRVDLLRNGTPEGCAEETRRILESGVKEGGKFILQEANNLPPGCPLDNLGAVYEACLRYGTYPGR